MANPEPPAPSESWFQRVGKPFVIAGAILAALAALATQITSIMDAWYRFTDPGDANLSISGLRVAIIVGENETLPVLDVRYTVSKERAVSLTGCAFFFDQLRGTVENPDNPAEPDVASESFDLPAGQQNTTGRTEVLTPWRGNLGVGQKDWATLKCEEDSSAPFEFTYEQGEGFPNPE